MRGEGGAGKVERGWEARVRGTGQASPDRKNPREVPEGEREGF